MTNGAFLIPHEGKVCQTHFTSILQNKNLAKRDILEPKKSKQMCSSDDAFS